MFAHTRDKNELEKSSPTTTQHYLPTEVGISVVWKNPKPADREDSATRQKFRRDGAPKTKPRASAPLSGEHATARGSTHERGVRALSSTTRVPRADSTASTRTFESTQRRLPSQRLPVLFPELRRRRAPGRNMSRLVRALLGLPKPKGSDEREPDDDDPPYPDVTVVVIINKRSGSRLVRGRTASRPFDSHAAFHVGSSLRALFGPPEASDPILTSHVSIRNSNRRACNSRAN
jgi:hypothetical protein